MPARSKAALLAVALCLAGGAAYLLSNGSSPEADVPAAMPLQGGVAAAAELDVQLRAPSDPPAEADPRDAPAAPEAVPPPEPQGLEDGGGGPLGDFTWKHGNFDRSRFEKARAEVAKRIRGASAVPPEDLLELRWLDEQLAKANEEDGSEGE